MVGSLVGWLVGWVVGWLVGWLKIDFIGVNQPNRFTAEEQLNLHRNN